MEWMNSKWWIFLMICLILSVVAMSFAHGARDRRGPRRKP